jgi:hypothetical protein
VALRKEEVEAFRKEVEALGKEEAGRTKAPKKDE